MSWPRTQHEVPGQGSNPKCLVWSWAHETWGRCAIKAVESTYLDSFGGTVFVSSVGKLFCSLFAWSLLRLWPFSEGGSNSSRVSALSSSESLPCRKREVKQVPLLLHMHSTLYSIYKWYMHIHHQIRQVLPHYLAMIPLICFSTHLQIVQHKSKEGMEQSHLTSLWQPKKAPQSSAQLRHVNLWRSSKSPG